MGVYLGLIAMCIGAGLFVAAGVSWVIDQVNGDAHAPQGGQFGVIWAICSIAVGLGLFLFVLRDDRRKRYQAGRQFSLRGQIYDFIADSREDGPLSREICFVGVVETSSMGPVYMVQASAPLLIDDYLSLNREGQWVFGKVPTFPREGFVQPNLPTHYVPVEIAAQTVAALNSALAAPFARGKVAEASALVRDSVPWQTGSYWEAPDMPFDWDDD